MDFEILIRAMTGEQDKQQPEQISNDDCNRFDSFGQLQTPHQQSYRNDKDASCIQPGVYLTVLFRSQSSKDEQQRCRTFSWI